MYTRAAYVSQRTAAVIYSMYRPFYALCDKIFGESDGASLPEMAATHGDSSGRG